MIFNTSCSQKRNYSMEFNEGLFKYEGEPLLFYKGMIDDEEKEKYLEKFELEIKEETGLLYTSNSINIIKNVASQKYYKGVIKLKFNTTNIINTDFTFDYNSVVPDSYTIYLLFQSKNNEKIKVPFMFYKEYIGYENNLYSKNYILESGGAMYVNDAFLADCGLQDLYIELKENNE